MEKFFVKNFMSETENLEFLVGTIVINAYSQLSDSSKVDLKELLETDEETSEKYVPIELKVFGMEVSLYKFMERYQDQFDEIVKREALKLLENKLGSITDCAYQIETEMKRQAKEKFGIKDEDWY